MSVDAALAEVIRAEAERQGRTIQWLADEVIRTGLRVKRIPIEGGE
jgi:hypothetical protein